jgi:hypothetical protein
MDPVLERALSPCQAHAPFLSRLRDRQVLQSLLIGAALVRSLRQDCEGPTDVTLSAEDYQLVRSLLQTPAVVAADETYDPLAADMVGRANVFMSVKYADYAENDNPFYSGGWDSDRGNRPGRELITRRELTDLGNVRSRMVRQLIGFLQRQADGYERFGRMGLARQPPDGHAWARAAVDDLIGYLRPWSAKQVRTHFDELRRAGMITAERPRSNGPWCYKLPEELTGRSAAFRGLPSLRARRNRTSAR